MVIFGVRNGFSEHFPYEDLFHYCTFAHLKDCQVEDLTTYRTSEEVEYLNLVNSVVLCVGRE